MNNDEFIEQFIKTVLRVYAEIPFEDMKSELVFINSRLILADEKTLARVSGEERLSYLGNFIEGETSEVGLKLVQLSADDDSLLKILTQEDFHEVISKLEYQYESKGEAQFFSAIKLSDDFRVTVGEMILQKFGQVMRTIFSVDPELIAGFTLKHKGITYDYSLKGQGPKLIFSNVKKHITFE